jgi:hypothetical protein
MASTATKVPKNVASYAKIAKKAIEKPYFEATECSLKIPPHLPTRQIPNTNEEFSFFVSLSSTDATQQEIANVMPNGVVGVIPRLDLDIVEFVCRDEDTVTAATTTPFQVEGKKPFYGILPRHRCSKVLLIKLANVPIKEESIMRTCIRMVWKDYGTILDMAPHKFPGKPWLTKRWDLLLELPEGEKKLKASPVWKINGLEDTMLATWPGAPKACLRCLVAGHSTSLCPEKNPKAGETANPLQRIDKENKTQKRKGKGPEVSTASSDKSKVPDKSSATQATLAVPAIQATTARKIAVASSSATGRPAPQPAAMETGQLPPTLRAATPPTFMEVEHTTPRKGSKRMAKGSEPWYPTREEVIKYLKEIRFCAGCKQTGHILAECQTSPPDTPFDHEAVIRAFDFKDHLEQWQRTRKKKGKKWKLGDIIQGPEVRIPNFFDE